MTWSQPVDLRSLLDVEDGWDTFRVHDFAVDGAGMLHIIANGSDQADPANGSPGTDARLVHAVLDPAGTLVHQSSLTLPVAAPQGYYPGGVASTFDQRGGVIAWVSGTEARLTTLTPTGRRQNPQRFSRE